MEKKDRKKWSKRLLKMITLGFMAVFLVACGGTDEPTVQEAETTQEEVIEAEVEKRVAEEKDKEEYNSNAHRQQIEDTEAYLIDDVISILDDSFSGFGYIEYNEIDQMFSVIPTDPAFMDEVLAVIDGQLPESEWYDVVDSFAYLSASVTDVLGEGYGLVLMNPDNLENMLLLVEDGTVVYEMLEDENVSSSNEMTNF